jgi:energy-coupling factor transport system substrate-specific component
VDWRASRVKRWGLLWTEIIEPEEVSSSKLQRTGAILVCVGAIGSVVVGLIIGFFQQALGGVGIALGLVPFLVLILVGAFMLGGREQVEAAREKIEGETAEA